MLQKRLISGTILSILTVASILADGYFSSLLTRTPSFEEIGDLRRWLSNGALVTGWLLVLAWLTAGELAHLARVQDIRPFDLMARLFTAGLVLGPYISCNLESFTRYRDESWAMLALALALGCGFLLQAIWRRTAHALVNLSATVFIIFYAGVLSSFLIKLRLEVGGMAGAALLLLTIACVKMTDTGAFFIGSLVGRRKLVEWLSPKKTWEGFFGGLATSVVFSLLLGGYFAGVGYIPITLHHVSMTTVLVVFGLLMGVVSVAGDLCASLLKRDAAVKDSSNMIPGMGGVLDILDSPLLAAPVAWFFWTRVAPLM